MDYGKKTHDKLFKAMSERPAGNSLASRIVAVDSIYKVLITDADGSNLAADIATIDGIVDTINVNTQYLYTNADAALANVTDDSFLAQICAVDGDISDFNDNTMSLEALNIDTDAIISHLIVGGDIHDVLYADAIGANLAVDIASLIAVAEAGEASDTFSYLDAGGEQTILEQTITTRRRLDSIWLDVTNLTQDGTFIIYHKINAGNYPEFDRGSFTVATDSDGILIDGFAVNNDWKITWTEGADEGANRDIPYCVIYQELE